MPTTTDEWERLWSDPRTGDIKRRVLGRLLNNIVAVGPSAPPAPPPAPSEAEKARQDDELARQHREMVDAEVAALDKHAAIVGQHVEAMESTSRGASSFMLQEFRAERRQLAELRAMLEADRDAGPIRTDRDGRELDDHARGYIRFRARELREQAWHSAEREARAGEHREARRHRIDALRSRMVAEFEGGHRASLPGYGVAMWT